MEANFKLIRDKVLIDGQIKFLISLMKKVKTLQALWL